MSAGPDVECIACAHLNMRSYPQHALDGQGECRAFHPTPWVRIGQKAACSAFAAVSEGQANKRRVWFANRHQPKEAGNAGS